MSKQCIIKQPFGIGDVLYCQKIAKHYQNLGYEIIWALKPSNMFLNDYIQDIEFFNEDEDFPHKERYMRDNIPEYEGDCIYLPLQYSMKVTRTRGITVMTSKYSMLGLDYSDWSDYVNLKRNTQKELELKQELGIEGDYCLVNRNYYPWKTGVDKVGMFKVTTDLPILEMKRIDGFTVLDWLGLLENAREIWTMDTCVSLMVSLLNISDSVPMHMFIRGDDQRTVSPITDSRFNIKLLKDSL